jgi:hypothetical protein
MEEEVMSRIKMLAAAALAVGAVAAGGLAAAPSASALPDRTAVCGSMMAKSSFFRVTADGLYATGYYALANYYSGVADGWFDAARACFDTIGYELP